MKIGAQMAGGQLRQKFMSSSSGALGQLSGRINEIGKEQKKPRPQKLGNLRTEVLQAHREFNTARDRVQALSAQIAKT